MVGARDVVRTRPLVSTTYAASKVQAQIGSAAERMKANALKGVLTEKSGVSVSRTMVIEEAHSIHLTAALTRAHPPCNLS